MARPQSNAILNRIFITLYRSLPMYLEYASPWTQRGDEKALATIQHIVADQKALCGRISDYILEHRGRIDNGDYPMNFTGLHDCSLDFLIGKLIENHRHDIRAIERSVGQVQEDAPARSLAEEALGAARGHLEALEELGGKMASSAGAR